MCDCEGFYFKNDNPRKKLGIFSILAFTDDYAQCA